MVIERIRRIGRRPVTFDHHGAVDLGGGRFDPADQVDEVF
jgi:hypothetical protein